MWNNKKEKKARIFLNVRAKINAQNALVPKAVGQKKTHFWDFFCKIPQNFRFQNQSKRFVLILSLEWRISAKSKKNDFYR